jgi:hypothetical protein
LLRFGRGTFLRIVANSNNIILYLSLLSCNRLHTNHHLQVGSQYHG